MKRFSAAFAVFVVLASVSFAQITLPFGCPQSSPGITDNCNGTFTSELSDRYRWEIEYSPGGITLSDSNEQTVLVNNSNPFPTAFGLKLTRKIAGVTTIECIHAVSNPGPIQYTIEELRPICNQRNVPCTVKAGMFRINASCGGPVVANWSFSSSSACVVGPCSGGSQNVEIYTPTTTCYAVGEVVTITASDISGTTQSATLTTTVTACGLIPLTHGKVGTEVGEVFWSPHSGHLKTIATDLLTGQQFILQEKSVERGDQIDLESEYKTLENGHLYDIRIMLDGETIESRKIHMD